MACCQKYSQNIIFYGSKSGESDFGPIWEQTTIRINRDVKEQIDGDGL